MFSHFFSNFDASLKLFSGKYILLQGCFIECEILQSPMISYRSLPFIVTIMNDDNTHKTIKELPSRSKSLILKGWSSSGEQV